MDSPIDVVPIGRHEAMQWTGENDAEICEFANRYHLKAEFVGWTRHQRYLWVSWNGREAPIAQGDYLVIESVDGKSAVFLAIPGDEFVDRYRTKGETRVIEGKWDDNIQEAIIGGVNVDEWLCDVPLDWTHVRVTIERLGA